ncbi:polymer-forming cytoskeletal protein [Bremerella sp. JC817]|uniref:bactofilin family protein n=1 Tax=Bremerella sp. JC817 TaxID=3231756 RepID=UPI003459FC20
MRTHLLSCLVVFALLAFVSPASAAEFLHGETVTIAADDTWEGDLYVLAQSVVVEGTITGDLVVYAQRVKADGDIQGGLIVAGQEILVKGKVGRTSRLAGQAILIDEGATLKGDLVAAGYSLEVAEGATVDGDVVFAGFQAALGGEIEDDVWAAVSRAEVSGSIGRELSITTGLRNGKKMPPPATMWQQLRTIDLPLVDPGLTIRDGASIGGKLTYRSPNEADIEGGAKVTGPIEWMKPQSPTAPAASDNTNYFWDQIKRYITMLLMGILMIVCCPKTTGQTVDQIVQRPIISFLAGFLAVPLSVIGLGLVAALIVAVPMLFGWLTLDGLAGAGAAIAAFGMVLYVGSLLYFFVFGAATLTCITIGRIVFSDHPIASRSRLTLALAFGMVFYVVLTCVPYLSVGVFVAALLFGFGGMLMWLLRGMFSGGSSKNEPILKTDS